MEFIVALAELRALVMEYASSKKPIDLPFVIQYVEIEGRMRDALYEMESE